MNMKLLKIATSASMIAMSVSVAYASTNPDYLNEAVAPQKFVRNDATLTLCDLLQSCEKTDKETFSHFSQLDMKVVDGFIREYFAIKNKSEANLMTTHFDSLMPLLRQFQAYMNTLTTSDTIEDLNADIEYLTRPRRTTGKPVLTIPVFLDFYARLIASVSKPTEEEKTVFTHATNPEYLLGLFENDAWKTPVKAFIETEEFDNKGQENEVLFYTQYISDNIIDLVEQLVRERVHPNIHYPMLGEDKLGVPFLTYMAIKRIYPFAFSTTSEVGAHGVDNLSPAAMSAHDFVHAELDQRVKFLKKHIIEKVDKLYYDAHMSESEIDAETIARSYTNVAIDRFLKIEETFEWFYGKLVSDVLPKHGLEAFKKVMGGFFWVMREATGFDESLFGKGSFIEVIDTFVDNALEKLNDEESSWEVPFNPFNTSTTDGISPFSNEEIIEQVKQTGDIEATYGKIKSAEVVYMPPLENADAAPKYRFIDVKFKFMNGHEETVSTTTMYHRLKNIEDARGLLAWSGLNVDPVEDATAYIDTVRNGIVDRINHFRDVFKEFVSTSEDQKYTEWVNAQEQDLQAKLPFPDHAAAMEQMQQEHDRVQAELEQTAQEANDRFNDLAARYEEQQALIQAEIQAEEARIQAHNYAAKIRYESEVQDIKKLHEAEMREIELQIQLRQAEIAEHEAQHQASMASASALMEEVLPEAVSSLREQLVKLEATMQSYEDLTEIAPSQANEFAQAFENLHDYLQITGPSDALMASLEKIAANLSAGLVFEDTDDKTQRFMKNCLKMLATDTNQ